MSTKTFITNLALTHIRVGRINNFDTDVSKNGKEAQFIYDHARKAALEAHGWSFARKQIAMNLTGKTIDRWDYLYTFPPDCLIPRKIVPQDLDMSRQPAFEILNIDGIKYICTNEANAGLVYTKDCEDEGQFTSLFEEALSRQMAAHFAVAIKGDSNLQAIQFQLFTSTVLTAKSADAMSDQNKREDRSDILEYRK
jgi:hypothetical protein